MVAVHCEIEIVMASSLTSYERINAPTTVDPNRYEQFPQCSIQADEAVYVHGMRLCQLLKA